MVTTLLQLPAVMMQQQIAVQGYHVAVSRPVILPEQPPARVILLQAATVRPLTTVEVLQAAGVATQMWHHPEVAIVTIAAPAHPAHLTAALPVHLHRVAVEPPVHPVVAAVVVQAVQAAAVDADKKKTI